MKTTFLILFVLVPFSLVQAQSFSNLDFEYWQRNKYPLFWQHPGITVCADSINKLSGAYSLKATRQGADIEKSKTGQALILQNVITAFKYSDIEHKRLEVSAQLKSQFTDSMAFACVFVQVIDAQHPQNNNIAIGNKVATDNWTKSSTSLDIPKVGIGTKIYMGVIMIGQGEMWLDDYKIMADDKLSEEVSPRMADLTDDEKQWLNAAIIPVYNELLTDGKRFAKVTSDALIVGVGDNVHGSATVFGLKNILSKALVEENGYTLLAIEDSPGVGEALNRYVHGKSGLLQRHEMNVMYANSNFIDFLNWLRQYNESAADKVSIYGVDVNGRYEAQIRYINKETGGKYSSRLDSINTIFKLRLAKWNHKGYEKIPFTDKDKSYFKENLEIIKTEVGQTDMAADRKTLLFYFVDNLLHYLDYDRQERERQMAENIKWILSHHSGKKMIYQAHNSHVGNTQSTMKATGSWLKETFEDKYYIVGTCYFDGTDSYKKNALRNSASVINESVKGSYEYLFNQIDRDCFFLDLKQVGKHDSLSNKWLTAPMLMRDYGVEPFNYYHEFSLIDITSQFNGIMFVKRSIPL